MRWCSSVTLLLVRTTPEAPGVEKHVGCFLAKPGEVFAASEGQRFSLRQFSTQREERVGCRGLGRGRAAAGEGGAWSRLEDPARGAVGAWPALWVISTQISTGQKAGPEADVEQKAP